MLLFPSPLENILDLLYMQICRIVECVGEGVTEFEKGDHVLTLFTGECMRCRHCLSDKSNICQVLGLERQGVMHSDKQTRFSIKGKSIFHYCAVSSFSEYTVVHSGCAVKISSVAPLDKICLLSCGVAAGSYLTSVPRSCDINRVSGIASTLLEDIVTALSFPEILNLRYSLSFYKNIEISNVCVPHN